MAGREQIWTTGLRGPSQPPPTPAAQLARPPGHQRSWHDCSQGLGKQMAKPRARGSAWHRHARAAHLPCSCPVTAGAAGEGWDLHLSNTRSSTQEGIDPCRVATGRRHGQKPPQTRPLWISPGHGTEAAGELRASTTPSLPQEKRLPLASTQKQDNCINEAAGLLGRCGSCPHTSSPQAGGPAQRLGQSKTRECSWVMYHWAALPWAAPCTFFSSAPTPSLALGQHQKSRSDLDRATASHESIDRRCGRLQGIAWRIGGMGQGVPVTGQGTRALSGAQWGTGLTLAPHRAWAQQPGGCRKGRDVAPILHAPRPRVHPPHHR